MSRHERWLRAWKIGPARKSPPRWLEWISLHLQEQLVDGTDHLVEPLKRSSDLSSVEALSFGIWVGCWRSSTAAGSKWLSSRLCRCLGSRSLSAGRCGWSAGWIRVRDRRRQDAGAGLVDEVEVEVHLEQVLDVSVCGGREPTNLHEGTSVELVVLSQALDQPPAPLVLESTTTATLNLLAHNKVKVDSFPPPPIGIFTHRGSRPTRPCSSSTSVSMSK